MPGLGALYCFCRLSVEELIVVVGETVMVSIDRVIVSDVCLDGDPPTLVFWCLEDWC